MGERRKSPPSLGWKQRPCERCGEDFTPKDPRQRFCGSSCAKRKVWPPPSKPCQTCGVLMTKPDASMGHEAWERRRYCSKLCLGASYRNPVVSCARCGGEFHPTLKVRTVYCSRTCFHADIVGKAKSPESRLSLARRRAALGQNFTPSTKKFLLRRANYMCETCGATEHLECDHVVPCHKGGTGTVENGQVLCRGCHRQKTTAEIRSAKAEPDQDGF